MQDGPGNTGPSIPSTLEGYVEDRDDGSGAEQDEWTIVDLEIVEDVGPVDHEGDWVVVMDKQV